jgi:glucosamine--fructose-6-phosphate aminotransferase (isomerizing)
VSATEKEILRIPSLLAKDRQLRMTYDNAKRYVFVGCGSSYNLGYSLSRFLRKQGIQSLVRTAGSILAVNDVPVLDPKKDIAVFISRTGESTETVLAEKRLREKGIHCIGVTCQRDSALIKNSDESYLYDVAYEESVVMTGSFVLIFDAFLGQFQPTDLSEAARSVLEETVRYIKTKELAKYHHFVFLGFRELLGFSREGALKLQEMALETVEFNEPLDYRHGPKSIISGGTFVLLQSMGTSYEKDLVAELRGYGAEVTVVGKDADISVDDARNQMPLRMIPVLWLGYQKALSKGIDPDTPKNLSKTVIL